MNKYRAVITGNQRTLIDDLLTNCEQLEAVSSSMNIIDLERHLKFYEPEVLIVCINEDVSKIYKKIDLLKNPQGHPDMLLIVVGNPEDIEEYTRVSKRQADIYLAKPITNSKIMSAIEDFIKVRNREAKAKKELERQRAEEERQREEWKKSLETRPHILIVDDDPNILALLKTQLEGKYKIATAVNGGLALRFLANKTTDLILLDYEMPIQSGPQVLTILRNSDTTKDIPVIFLTGVNDTEKIAKVLALNPQGYLLKPVDCEGLKQTVARVLEEYKNK